MLIRVSVNGLSLSPLEGRFVKNMCHQLEEIRKITAENEASCELLGVSGKDVLDLFVRNKEHEEAIFCDTGNRIFSAQEHCATGTCKTSCFWSFQGPLWFCCWSSVFWGFFGFFWGGGLFFCFVFLFSRNFDFVALNDCCKRKMSTNWKWIHFEEFPKNWKICFLCARTAQSNAREAFCMQNCSATSAPHSNGEPKGQATIAWGLCYDLYHRDFVRDLICHYTGVYTKNRNFRLFLSSKMNKKNPLVSAGEKECTDKELFLKSLVANVE